MRAHYSNRLPAELDAATRAFRVDSSWYEDYWLKECKPRPAGMVARNLATMRSRVRLTFDRAPLVGRAVLASALRPKTHPDI